MVEQPAMRIKPLRQPQPFRLRPRQMNSSERFMIGTRLWHFWSHFTPQLADTFHVNFFQATPHRCSAHLINPVESK
jgi:hypothetical protein